MRSQSLQRQQTHAESSSSLTTSSERLRTLIGKMNMPIDIAPLVYVRILFGAIMFWEISRYFSHDWIARYYIKPTLWFSYFGFEWVKPWGGDLMYIHFALLGALAICIALGLWYRASTVLFFLGFTYVFLLDETQYLNHFYLIVLISFLLCFIPANRTFSLDAKLHPEIRRTTAPTWSLWLLRFQIGVAYFFGGIAKLSSDWLHGEPMRAWLAERVDFPVIGSLFTDEPAVYMFVYGGLLLDLFIVPCLLWRRTRVAALCAAVSFHLLNAMLFKIGIFPWFMLAMTAIFFPPESLRRFGMFFKKSVRGRKPKGVKEPMPLALSKPALLLMGGYIVLQVIIPLRHFLYTGDVNWTEEGHRFSWHMKLRDKDAELSLVATDSDSTWNIDPREYVMPHQTSKVAAWPDMILQLSHYIADDLRHKGHRDVKIYARANASVNGREPQLMIDPDADLVQVQRSILPADWILPLKQPLPEHDRARQDSDED